MPLSNYLFEHLLQELDVNSDAGKSALWAKANEMIALIPSEFYRDSLLERLANLVGRKRTEQQISAGKNRKAAVVVQSTKITPMRRAIALLLQYPSLAQVMPVAPELAQANMPGMSLLMAIQQHLLEKPQLTTAQLLEYWRELPEYNILSKLALWDHQVAEEQLTQEFSDTFRSIEDQYLQQRLESLQRKDQLSKLSVAEKHEYVMLLKAFKSK